MANDGQIEGWSFEVQQPDGSWQMPRGARKFSTEAAALRACNKYIDVCASEGWATTGRTAPLIRAGSALIVGAQVQSC